MIVMPANNTNAYALAEQFPNRIGMMFSPDGWKAQERVPYVLDNGRFVLLGDASAKWDEIKWRKMLDAAQDHYAQPQWVAVPDMPGNSEETRRLWDHWHYHLTRDYPEWRFAYVVQDGATPETVPENADVVFIGGTTRWKRKTLWGWCHKQHRPVHVGRINTERWLWECHRAGAQSCDGTGWYRGDQKQLAGLLRYLRRSQAGLTTAQLELEYAATFTPHADDFVTACSGMLTRERKQLVITDLQ
jgi:hypothetical protein